MKMNTDDTIRPISHKSQPFTAVILNGGKASRYSGVDKQLLLIGTTSMGRILASLLKNKSEELFIVGRPNSMYDDLADGQYEDTQRGRGPLEGLHVAMQHASNRWIFLCAADMPFVSIPLIERLFDIASEERSEIVLSEFDMVVQPFNAFYRRDLVDSLGDYLETQSNLSLWNFIKTRRFTVIPSEDVAAVCDAALVFQNVNDPASYEKALKMSERRGFRW